MFGLSELAILLIVILIVFGAKKLPDLARNAGKAARILKSEAKAMKAQEPPADGPGQPPRTIQGQVDRSGPQGGGTPPADGVPRP
ncbi:twin-arginine translocase TatA/TatE family subunit [Streptomyces zhihengii]|uniref:Sec-independent protein translocase protein TatA n=2 Tax=Streptomyces zhihengii TaxID=1818004 RepID=A0ABS2V1J4_9ACTN|nr:twin-arginine translocase TatA/TatE family subunit [Streptomyces zhihengii]MBM9623473.1 twin-arginine translocase TatA/TatE family subunit [Streptomyces zhihengii]